MNFSILLVQPSTPGHITLMMSSFNIVRNTEIETHRPVARQIPATREHKSSGEPCAICSFNGLSEWTSHFAVETGALPSTRACSTYGVASPLLR